MQREFGRRSGSPTSPRPIIRSAAAPAVDDEGFDLVRLLRSRLARQLGLVLCGVALYFAYLFLTSPIFLKAMREIDKARSASFDQVGQVSVSNQVLKDVGVVDEKTMAVHSLCTKLSNETAVPALAQEAMKRDLTAGLTIRNLGVAHDFVHCVSSKDISRFCDATARTHLLASFKGLLDKLDETTAMVVDMRSTSIFQQYGFDMRRNPLDFSNKSNEIQKQFQESARQAANEQRAAMRKQLVEGLFDKPLQPLFKGLVQRGYFKGEDFIAIDASRTFTAGLDTVSQGRPQCE